MSGINDNNRACLFNTNKAGWQGQGKLDDVSYRFYIVASGAPESAAKAPTHLLFYYFGKNDTANMVALFAPRQTEKTPKEKIAEGSSDDYWVHVFMNTSDKSGQKYITVKFHPKEQQHGHDDPADEVIDDGSEELPF